MIERRRTPRGRTYLGGALTFNHRAQTLSCLVRDISDTGARLAFSGAVPLPEALDLAIPALEQSLRVRVTWRRDDAMGVAFLGPAPSGAPGTGTVVGLAEARRNRTRP